MVSGENRFDIYLHEDDTRSGIREIYVGPRDEIDKTFNRHKAWAKFSPLVAVVASLFVIVLAILGFLFGNRHKTYLFLGIIACTLIYQSMLSLAVGTEAIIPLAMVVRFLLPIALMILLATLFYVDRDEWTVFAPYKYAFYALAFTGQIVGLSIITLPFLLPEPVFFATLLMLGSFPLLFALGGQRLTVDMASRRSQLEKLRARVSEQEVELDEKGHALAREMRNRAVLEERQRFTRDIHDGIGGQLLSLILKVRTGKLDQGEIVSELQAGLNDLRLVVDSMDHTGGNLKAALTTFKSRATSQVRAAKIDMEWNQSDPLYMKFEQTNGTLNIYRFMQEAFTNIIRHASAEKIRVEIKQEGEQSPLCITIEDDGVGFQEGEEPSAGKGLGNLKSRAALVGGEAKFTTGIDGKGAGVELVIQPKDKS